MTQPENVILNAIVDKLEDMGCVVIKIHGSPFVPAGTPDLIGVYRGAAFVIEVKQPGLDADRIQKYRLKLWGDAGARTGVAHDIMEAINIVLGKDEDDAK